MTLSTLNRDEAYMKIMRDNDLGKMQEAVYEGIIARPELTDQELAEYLNLPLATINGRRNELVDLGLVEEAGSRLNSKTNKHRTTWIAKDPYRAILSTKNRAISCISDSKMQRIRKEIRCGNDYQKKLIKTWCDE